MFALFNCTNCSCANKEDYHINVIKEPRHTYNYKQEPNIHPDTTSKPPFEETATLSLPDQQNDLIIIEYPYERKKTQIPNLFIEKPQQPMQNQITQYTFKHHTNTEPDLLGEAFDEFNSTLNEGLEFNEGIQTIRKLIKTEESLSPNINITPSKTDAFSANQNKLSRFKDPIAQLPNNTSFRKGMAKAEKDNKKYPIKTTNNYSNSKPIQIHKQLRGYCENCEEIYMKCLNNDDNNSNAHPSKKKCKYCDKGMNIDSLSFCKTMISPIESNQKATRNTKTSTNNVDPLCKSKTITKFKLSASKNSNKPDALITETKNANNSFTDEKRLFTKKYSFLQLHSYSSKLIKKESKKHFSKELTSREYIMSSSRRYSHYRLPIKKHQSSLTISFGDENSQYQFEKKREFK